MKANPLAGFLESVELRMVRPSRAVLRSESGPMSGLMMSIQDKGLLEPIIVRPSVDGYEVVAGMRRYEACRKLGWRRVPAHVVELDDREAFEVSLLENIQRETLNPIEEARAFRSYVEEYGYGGETELARKIGKSQEYVSKRIGLLSLPQRVQDQIMRRRITPSVAQELTLLNDEDAEEMADEIGARQLTLREVRRIIRHRQSKEEAGGDTPSFGSTERAGLEKRVRRVSRELNIAIASLGGTVIRLGEVAENLESEWVVRESIFICRDAIREQIGNLTKLKRKYEKAEESNPGRLSVIG
ncbi:MAG: ParB/RepB/Spo0J family partition protein [Nitrososphaerota archaeon]|nr:ParB/RepB/Spo0J family partition protein [Nitrososphaerota archaeon]MDG7023616.1 ParB/RepB/Spo0J family partition protein [Nitrososphaerota archaeon]